MKKMSVVGLMLGIVLLASSVWAEEGDGRRSRKRRYGGTIKSRHGNTLVLEQRGDSGSRTRTFNLTSATKILVETDEYEEYTGEGGKIKRRRKYVAGNRADLKEGLRATVTARDSDAAEVKVYLPKKKREGGERESEVSPPPSSGGGKESDREGGERSKGEKKRGDGEDSGEGEKKSESGEKDGESKAWW